MIFTKNNWLQFFADGGSGAPSGGTNGGTADAGQSNDGNDTSAGTEQKVVYGLQPNDDNAEGDPASEGEDSENNTENTLTEAERRKAYNAMKREYKDFFAEDTQKIINRRFKETRDLEENNQKQEKVLDYLYARYNVDNLDDLAQKVENDDRLLTREDDAFGFGEGESAEMKRLRIANAQMTRQLKRTADEERARRFNTRVANEEREFRERFPGFSVVDEIKANPSFARLLQSGVSVKDAYFAVHHEEITKSALEHAQADAVKKATENVRARGNRPRENGAGGSPGLVVKSDPSVLTKSDREEIARRIMRGEIISF